MIIIRDDDIIAEFRNRVLLALDQAARDTFRDLYHFDMPIGQEGAIDADLPELFKAIDAQVARVAKRLGVILEKEETKP